MKYFEDMDAVRSYIVYKELKELLKDEQFILFGFPQDIVQVLREYHVQVKYYEIKCSQSWVYAEGVYIPKQMIRGTYAWENIIGQMKLYLN